MHGGGGIGRRFEIVAERGAERRLIARLDLDRVEHRRPSFFSADARALASVFASVSSRCTCCSAAMSGLARGIERLHRGGAGGLRAQRVVASASRAFFRTRTAPCCSRSSAAISLSSLLAAVPSARQRAPFDLLASCGREIGERRGRVARTASRSAATSCSASARRVRAASSPPSRSLASIASASSSRASRASTPPASSASERSRSRSCASCVSRRSSSSRARFCARLFAIEIAAGDDRGAARPAAAAASASRNGLSFSEAAACAFTASVSASRPLGDRALREMQRALGLGDRGFRVAPAQREQQCSAACGCRSATFL